MTKDYRLSHLGERKTSRYEEEIYKKGSYDDLMWEVEKPLLLAELNDFKKTHASIHYLDFGCGTGRITQLLEDEVEESLGIDISPEMLAIAKSKLHKTELLLADLPRKDVIEGMEFDLITSFRVLLNAGPALRKEMLQVLVPKLKEEGVFIFNMHGNILSYRFFTKIWLAIKGRHLNTISYWQTKNLLHQYDLRIMRWYGLGVVPKFFYRIFPKKYMHELDIFLTRIPYMKYFAYNLIFVCQKKI